MMAVNFKITAQERLVGASFVNMNERNIQITEFLDNEHFSALESLIIQLNNSSADSKFRVLINMPNDLIKEKLLDLLKMCEVDYQICNKKDFATSQIQT